jgi:hypothetical protein
MAYLVLSSFAGTANRIGCQKLNRGAIEAAVLRTRACNEQMAPSRPGCSSRTSSAFECLWTLGSWPMRTIGRRTCNYLKEMPHPGRILVRGAIKLVGPAVVTHSVRLFNGTVMEHSANLGPLPSQGISLNMHFSRRSKKRESRCP